MDRVLIEDEEVVMTELVVAVGPHVKTGVSKIMGDTARFLFKDGGIERWE
jgi:hypothetical protein